MQLEIIKNGYPNEVWKAIRQLWEVSPKSTSLQTILNQVADTLACDVPSVQAVSVRLKRDKWKKLSAKVLKKSIDLGVEKQQALNSEKQQENNSKTNRYKDVLNSENNIDFIENKIGLIVNNQSSSKLQKIETLRRQAWNIFNITESAIDGLAQYIAKLEHINVAVAGENEISALKLELSLFERMVHIANTASQVNERTTKMLIGLQGFDNDDFKDKKDIQAQRQSQLAKLDNVLEERRLLMAEQQKEAFNRNLAAIEDKMRCG